MKTSTFVTFWNVGEFVSRFEAKFFEYFHSVVPVRSRCPAGSGLGLAQHTILSVLCIGPLEYNHSIEQVTL